MKHLKYFENVNYDDWDDEEVEHISDKPFKVNDIVISDQASWWDSENDKWEISYNFNASKIPIKVTDIKHSNEISSDHYHKNYTIPYDEWMIRIQKGNYSFWPWFIADDFKLKN